MITGTMLYAVQQDEQQPTREWIRNKTGYSQARRNTMNDNFMKRAFDDWQFRRCSGLMGRNPTAPAGQRSEAGA
eukprot:11105305-Alexandrium_andersonii.AAC.1